MAEEARAATLRRQRGNIKGALTRFKASLEAYAALPITLRIPERLQASLDNLKQRYQGFEEIQDELEEYDETEIEKRGEIEDMYDFAIGEAARHLTPLKPAVPQDEDNTLTQPATPNSTASLFSLLRLPELDIPKFDGSYENYHPFWDAFDCSINKNPDLSRVQRLQYFRSLLTGRAAKAIESLSNTDDNYETALEIIKKKFDCTKKIIRRHWELLNDYPRLLKDTPEALGHLVDTVYQHTRALVNLGQPVDQWDLPLIYLIQSKISAETSYRWELTINDSKLPKYTSLLEFLEKRSDCSTVTTSSATTSATTSSSSRNGNSNRNRRGRQAFVSATTLTAVTCTMCKENHHIMRCPTFKKFSVLERFHEAKKLGLCINCLTPGHSVTRCNSRCCSECGKPHNLLHRPENSTGEKSPTTAATTPRDS